MSEKSTPFSEIQCGDLILNLEMPQIMGIINLTEDSFFDGGSYIKERDYLLRAESLLGEGAVILDIGAASTRPGSPLISEIEEWQKLEQPLKKIRAKFPKAILSVDTYNSAQVKRCSDLGINIINDISGGAWDDQMYREIARTKMAYVMMHIQGTPENMQNKPQYQSVVEEVKAAFVKGIEKLEALNYTNIILDPGFGFGKGLTHNYTLLAQLVAFLPLKYPVLAGLSRKSMIFKVLDIRAQEALNGSTALNMIALLNGAKILRVHDAKEANETIRLFSKYKEVLEPINK